MRKMRGVGQLALLSTDPPRVAEFYESAFGFRRLADDDGGVDLELGGFELSFRRGERATREGIQIGFKVDTAGEVDAWAQELGAPRLRPRRPAVRRPMGGLAELPDRRSRRAAGRRLLRLSALTIRSKSVYHPAAIRARSQGHPSVIGRWPCC